MHTKKTNNTNKLMQISYHFALTKIQKLQNLKKKKKNFFFCTGRYARYRPVLPEIGRYARYMVGTLGIFSGTKQEGYTYWIACWYSIFRLYRLVRYGIDSLTYRLPFQVILPLHSNTEKLITRLSTLMCHSWI